MKTTMEERMVKMEKNMANLKAAYESFSASPRYVSNHSYYPQGIELRFEKEEAIESVCVEINWDGDFAIKLWSWSACPNKTKNAIESKTFESAEEALDYALETVNKINSFFHQF